MERQELAGIRPLSPSPGTSRPCGPDPVARLFPGLVHTLGNVWAVLEVGALGTSWGHQPQQGAHLLDLLPPRQAIAHLTHQLEMTLVGQCQEDLEGPPVSPVNQREAYKTPSPRACLPSHHTKLKKTWPRASEQFGCPDNCWGGGEPAARLLGPQEVKQPRGPGNSEQPSCQAPRPVLSRAVWVRGPEAGRKCWTQYLRNKAETEQRDDILGVRGPRWGGSGAAGGPTWEGTTGTGAFQEVGSSIPL